MARARSIDRPRTPYTDANGNVIGEYQGLWFEQCISEARKAGIPSEFLHRSGWSGDESDVTGYWTGIVYRFHDLGLKCDEPDVQEILDEAKRVAVGLGADVRMALEPLLDSARFIRWFNEGNGYWPSRPREAHDDPDLMFGAPSGSEHDLHGHGLSNGHWTCFEEESPSDEEH